MVITSIFIVVAIGILAFAIITSPLYDVLKQDAGIEAPKTKENARIAYQHDHEWLGDLEVEYAAGKVDVMDYERQKAALQVEAQRYYQQLSDGKSRDAGPQIEGLINNRRMSRVERSAGFCVKCGAPLTQSDTFCPNCGMKSN